MKTMDDLQAHKVGYVFENGNIDNLKKIEHEYHLSNSPMVIHKDQWVEFTDWAYETIFDGVEIYAETMTEHMIDHDLDLIQLTRYNSETLLAETDYINKIILRFTKPETEMFFKLMWL